MRTKGGLFALFITILVLAVIVLPLAGCLDASVPGDTAVRDELPDLQSELQGKIQDISNNTASLASTIHRLINDERRKDGLQPLQWDPALANIALSHSKDMAERDYFDHISPEGEDFADRYAENGYRLETQIGDRIYVGGENLFLNNVVRTYTYDEITNEVLEYQYNSLDELARSTVQGWMESQGHRENILTPFTREGIGIFVTDEGKVYITENFS
jgi:uncharacterized protein YkwD